MATLTVEDDGSGTTATATIAGSAGGANVIYTQQVTGDIGSGSWTNSGNRTGDGDVTLTLAKGFYFGYCLTDGVTVSGLVYFQVSSSDDSVLDRIIDSMTATLQLLSLPCTERIYDSQFLNTPAMQYPCIVLTTEKARNSNEMRLNGTDGVGHPIRLVIKDVVMKFDDDRRATYRSWQQAIRRCFLSQRIAGVIESIKNEVEYGDVAAVESNFPQVVCEILVRAHTREVRGVGA